MISMIWPVQTLIESKRDWDKPKFNINIIKLQTAHKDMRALCISIQIDLGIALYLTTHEALSCVLSFVLFRGYG